MQARAFVLAAIAALVLTTGPLQADVMNMGAGLTSLQFVPVGNPGNAGKLSGTGSTPTGNGTARVCGEVDYNYNIGKYEVTAAQYCAFLNAVAATDTYGLWNNNMTANAMGCEIVRSGKSGSYAYSVAADYANRPVNYTGVGDAMRFSNWLTNGQPTGVEGPGTTEDGAYLLNGANTDAAILAIVRNVTGGTQFFLPSEDEWYKAAYYDPNKPGGAGYWDYPTCSNTKPGMVDPDTGNNGCLYEGGYCIGSPYYRTPVGEFASSPSPYGTFDQGGNCFEWCDTPYDATTEVMRGASFSNYGTAGTNGLAASQRTFKAPTGDMYYTGFRVTEIVPEPATLGLLVLGGLPMLRRRRH